MTTKSEIALNNLTELKTILYKTKLSNYIKESVELKLKSLLSLDPDDTDYLIDVQSFKTFLAYLSVNRDMINNCFLGIYWDGTLQASVFAGKDKDRVYYKFYKSGEVNIKFDITDFPN